MVFINMTCIEITEKEKESDQHNVYQTAHRALEKASLAVCMAAVDESYDGGWSAPKLPSSCPLPSVPPMQLTPV